MRSTQECQEANKGKARKSTIPGVDWDDSTLGEEAANFNKFREMILVSQAADVQLDFMRRICPESTARQTLQELVIFLNERFEEDVDNGCYVTLDIPVLKDEREHMLRISSNSTGGCDVKEQRRGGLAEWILETGKSVNTTNVVEETSLLDNGQPVYSSKLDGIPMQVAQRTDNVPIDFKGYFGFFLTPFDANEEEKMCIVVGIRMTRGKSIYKKRKERAVHSRIWKSTVV